LLSRPIRGGFAFIRYNEAMKIIRSFSWAVQGVREALTERNFKFQVFAGFIVMAGAAIFNVPFIERIILLMCIMLVLSAEMVNSSVERLTNFVSPDHRREIAAVKDLMAGAVLLFAFGSAVIGFLIFTKAIF
jgi:diacylglycerol kinase